MSARTNISSVSTQIGASDYNKDQLSSRCSSRMELTMRTTKGGTGRFLDKWGNVDIQIDDLSEI